MGRHVWVTGLALLVELLGSHGASAQASHPTGVVCVLLQDIAGVPPQTLEAAKYETARVFKRSALTFSWVTGESFGGQCLIVRIVKTPPGGHYRDPRILGVALGTKDVSGRHAWVFYDRVRIASSRIDLDESQMLGHVIAHELGHLLLPYGQHAVVGVMRPKWDRAQVENAAAALLTVKPGEVAIIRRRLSESALP